MHVETSIPALRSESNRQALAYWDSQRNGDAVPRRVDLVAVAGLLDGIILVDVLSEPLDFGYRFAGTRIDEFMERTLTGLTALGIPHQRPPSRIWEAFRKAVEQRAPVAGEVPYVGPQRDFVAMEDVIMPVAADGHRVSSLFIAVDFFRAAEAGRWDAHGFSLPPDAERRR